MLLKNSVSRGLPVFTMPFFLKKTITEQRAYIILFYFNWLGQISTVPLCSAGPVWCEGEIHPTLMGNKKENRSRRRKDSIPDESIGKKATIIGMPEESEGKFIFLWGFLFYILKLKYFLWIMQMNLHILAVIIFVPKYLFTYDFLIVWKSFSNFNPVFLTKPLFYAT